VPVAQRVLHFAARTRSGYPTPGARFGSGRTGTWEPRSDGLVVGQFEIAYCSPGSPVASATPASVGMDPASLDMVRHDAS
jgi:hypothetical protein